MSFKIVPLNVHFKKLDNGHNTLQTNELPSSKSRWLSFRARSRANFKIQDFGLHARKSFRLGEITFFLVV